MLKLNKNTLLLNYKGTEIMKKNFKAIINYYFIAALASLLLIGGCALKEKVHTAEVTVENPSVYTASEEKIKKLGTPKIKDLTTRLT